MRWNLACSIVNIFAIKDKLLQFRLGHCSFHCIFRIDNAKLSINKWYLALKLFPEEGTIWQRIQSSGLVQLFTELPWMFIQKAEMYELERCQLCVCTAMHNLTRCIFWKVSSIANFFLQICVIRPCLISSIYCRDYPEKW